jgi:hypothetical protein
MNTMATRCGAALGTCLAVALSSVPAVSAPSREVAEAARRDAHAMYEAFRKGKLDEFAAYTYPGLLKMAGGKQKMVEMLEKGLADMAKEGFRFVSGVVAPPTQVVKAGSELHALLPLKQVMSAPGGELNLAGHLLGISADGGKTWTFIDSAKLTAATVRQILPNYNPELKLPPASEPKFVPKK